MGCTSSLPVRHSMKFAPSSQANPSKTAIPHLQTPQDASTTAKASSSERASEDSGHAKDHNIHTTSVDERTAHAERRPSTTTNVAVSPSLHTELSPATSPGPIQDNSNDNNNNSSHAAAKRSSRQTRLELPPTQLSSSLLLMLPLPHPSSSSNSATVRSDSQVSGGNDDDIVSLMSSPTQAIFQQSSFFCGEADTCSIVELEDPLMRSGGSTFVADKQGEHASPSLLPESDSQAPPESGAESNSGTPSSARRRQTMVKDKTASAIVLTPRVKRSTNGSLADEAEREQLAQEAKSNAVDPHAALQEIQKQFMNNLKIGK